MKTSYAATLILTATLSAPALAQTQGWYESNGDFWNRQTQQQNDQRYVTQQSTAEIQRQQAQAASINEGYAKRGRSVIAANRATTAFASSPSFSITSHLLKQAQSAPGGQAYVPIIRAQAEPAKRQFFAMVAQAGYQTSDFVEVNAYAAVLNAPLLTGRAMPTAAVQRRIGVERKRLLGDAIFQGVGNLEKQTRVEEVGVRTIYALQLAQAARSGDRAAGGNARQFAQDNLRLILGRDPTAAELSGQ